MAEGEGSAFSDDTLERELREALKSDAEITLFKQVCDRYSIKDELAGSAVVKTILRNMWQNVGDFFAEIVEADSLIGLQPDHALVKKHYRMQADFLSVASINKTLIEGRLAEEELLADDQMEQTMGALDE